MEGKIAVSVFFIVLIAIFAYYYLTLPQTSSETVINRISQEAEQALESATEIKVFTGTLVEIGNENLMLRTNEGILTIKKSEATKYVALDNGISTQIDENALLQNDEATIVVGVGINNETTALSISVVR